MTTKQRVVWIDAARGLGIFFIVLGHTPLPGFIFKYLFSFHVPLFFFISGLLFNKDKFPDWKSFLIHRGKRLLLAYFVFAVLIYLYWLVFGYITAAEPIGSQSIWAIFYGSDSLKYMFTPLWFLPCLFITENIFYLLQKYLKQGWLLLVISILTLIGLIYGRVNLQTLPWSLEVSLVAVSFYYMGFLSQKVLSEKKVDWFLPVLFIVGAAFALMNHRVDLLSHTYGNWFYFYLSALAGIGLIIGVSQIWPMKFLQILGRDSLFILAFHQVFLFLTRFTVNYFWPNFNFAELGKSNLLIGFGLTVVSISLCYLLLFIYKNTVLRFDFFKKK